MATRGGTLAFTTPEGRRSRLRLFAVGLDEVLGEGSDGFGGEGGAEFFLHFFDGGVPVFFGEGGLGLAVFHGVAIEAEGVGEGGAGAGAVGAGVRGAGEAAQGGRCGGCGRGLGEGDPEEGQGGGGEEKAFQGG